MNKKTTHIKSILLILTLLAGNTGLSKQSEKELRDGWKELEGCELVESKGNDGDSFHVMHLDKEYVFRLYLVDCPETDIEMIGRNVEQIQDFGAPLEKLLIAGKLATGLTKELLSKPFKVLTKGENAMGQTALGRSYAFVTTSKGEDLGEILLEHGLARSHGRDAEAPTVRSDLQGKYDRIADRIKRGNVGAWGKKEVKLPTNSLVNSADLARAKREVREMQRENREHIKGLVTSLGEENIEIQD
jgi:endonuclease YncB( thermonuclease family)